MSGDKKKIIMTGFCQTGQISPAVAIHSFMRDCHGFDILACQSAIDGDLDMMLSLVEKYDCVRDWPFSLFTKEIAAEFPEAVFLHTERASADRWFDNIMPYTKDESAKDFGFIFEYWFGKPHLGERDREMAIRVYDDHNSWILDSVPADRLYHFCIDGPDHWEQVAQVVGPSGGWRRMGHSVDRMWGATPRGDRLDLPFPTVDTRPAWIYYTQSLAIISGNVKPEYPARPLWTNNSLGG